MRRLLLIIFSVVVGLSNACSGQPIPVPHKPMAVILDTDMDSDIDDVGALAMLHCYEKAGKVRILGVIVTSDEQHSAICTDAINTYFGRGDLPIGVSQRDSLKAFSKYTQAVSQEFPHKLLSSKDAENSTSLYRRLLAGEPDGSVVIITIGHLTSLSKLLNSQPDAISTLSGQALVAKKVKRWSCMGGQFPSGKEANFYRPDPASTVNCLAKWTLPVTFAGWEVGNQLVTGGVDFKERCQPNSPIYRGYELYNNFKGRASWDQVAILEAVEGVSSYFSLIKDGHCVVSADGSNEWKSPINSMHGYLAIKSTPNAIRKRIEMLMLGNF
ncbi:nucleoside hydrolase [Spirosoma endbachense]|uniref:Nucleoside hydrolase n=1 Tax=Spirosoma endbachense TaxID=2666025 RepID=A0A6P1VXD6_9BACT|nr:nucleoside hydrolase [Spirosoma endbachense]QHV97851.1 nucleoside hydrolase [Spirosoma endbachense]